MYTNKDTSMYIKSSLESEVLSHSSISKYTFLKIKPKDSLERKRKENDRQLKKKKDLKHYKQL